MEYQAPFAFPVLPSEDGQAKRKALRLVAGYSSSEQSGKGLITSDSSTSNMKALAVMAYETLLPCLPLCFSSTLRRQVNLLLSWS